MATGSHEARLQACRHVVAGARPMVAAARLVFVEHEVLELEVPVADLHRVAVRDGIEQLQEEPLRHGLRHALVPLGVLVQVALRSMC